ncbi:hypothetical protein [Actinomyces lilanjuaniae]|uniref:hypothetical protein n=1 Tax=Actinomyces lilanjuaniae TaxID=2321394 RepID=UPI0013C47B9D|nr:hypothetical protein [Actinomyces lilanjuaniae]
MTGVCGSGEPLGDRARGWLRRVWPSGGRRRPPGCATTTTTTVRTGSNGPSAPGGPRDAPGSGLPGVLPCRGPAPGGSAAVLLAAAALRQGVYGWCGVLGGEGWAGAPLPSSALTCPGSSASLPTAWGTMASWLPRESWSTGSMSSS